MRAQSRNRLVTLAAAVALLFAVGAARAEPPPLATVLAPDYRASNEPCGVEPTAECVIGLARDQFRAIEIEHERIYTESYAWAALHIAGSEESRAAADSWFVTDWPLTFGRVKEQYRYWSLSAAATEAGRYDQARVAAKRIEIPELRAIALAHTAWREARDCQLDSARRDIEGAQEALAAATVPSFAVYAAAQIVKALGAIENRSDRPDYILQIDTWIHEAKSHEEGDRMRYHLAYAYIWSGRDRSAYPAMYAIVDMQGEALAHAGAARSWADVGRLEDAEIAIRAAEARFELIDDPTRLDVAQAQITPVIVHLRGVGPALDYALGIENPISKARALERIVHAA